MHLVRLVKGSAAVHLCHAGRIVAPVPPFVRRLPTWPGKSACLVLGRMEAPGGYAATPNFHNRESPWSAGRKILVGPELSGATCKGMHIYTAVAVRRRIYVIESAMGVPRPGVDLGVAPQQKTVVVAVRGCRTARDLTSSVGAEHRRVRAYVKNRAGGDHGKVGLQPLPRLVGKAHIERLQGA